MIRTPMTFVLPGALLAAALACAALRPDPASGAPEAFLYEAGTVAAVNTVAVASPPIGGGCKVVFLKDEGTVVAAGDTLVVLENDRIGTLLRQVQADGAVQDLVVASVVAANASHALAAHNAIAKARLDRESAVLAEEKQRFSAPLEQERAALGRRLADFALARALQDSAAQAGLDSLSRAGAEIQREKLRARTARYQGYVDMLVVTAPAAGMVVYHRERSDDGVSVVRLGDEVNWSQHLLDITDVSTLQIELAVHERDVGRVRTGLRVTAVPEAYPDRTYTGHVTSVQALPESGEAGALARQYPVVALLDGVDGDLMPGMSVRVTIELEDDHAAR